MIRVLWESNAGGSQIQVCLISVLSCSLNIAKVIHKMLGRCGLDLCEDINLQQVFQNMLMNLQLP